MADYKKKKISKKVSIQKLPKEKRTESIAMHSQRRRVNKPYREHSTKSSLTLIRGKKAETKLSFMLTVSVVIVFLCVYFVILVFHPIGVTEYFSALYKSIGTGDVYSSEFSSKNTIDCVRCNDYYYLLTDTKVECINNSGKIISTTDHGFAKPVIDVAETRYLVYGQGEQTVKIFKFEKESATLHYDEAVLCADIADNGSFAVATYADGYDSVVRVYNKNEKVLYEWYSSDGIVSSVNLTANGKKLLVTTITANDGSFNTRVRLLNFNSADPEKSILIENDLIYNIYELSKNRICAVSENDIRFINLKDGSVKRESTEYSYRLIDRFDKYLVVLSSLSANSDVNHISIYNSNGNASSFVFERPVNYMVFRSGYLYILSDSSVYRIDKEGNTEGAVTVPFDTKVIVPISEKYIIAINNSSISKVSLENTE